jgi:hypothetical protein
VGVRLQRADLGWLIGAGLAVALIGGFLAATSGSPDDDAASAGPTTTEAPRSGLVPVRSQADPDLAWSTGRGAFFVECENGRVAYLDAKVSRLPIDHRYAWRVIVGERNTDTAPLTARPGVSGELIQGDGLPSAFSLTEDGEATVRFTFANPRPDVAVALGLTVLDVGAQDAFVLAAPPLTCRDAG